MLPPDPCVAGAVPAPIAPTWIAGRGSVAETLRDFAIRLRHEDLPGRHLVRRSFRKLRPHHNPYQNTLPPDRPPSGHRGVSVPLLDAIDEDHVVSPWNFFVPMHLHPNFGTTETIKGLGRGAPLWPLGIPTPIILLLALFWHS